MKIERLYAITIYLLNHKRASANELAKHFEVSQRTIQRDMDSLCLAGIPISSVAGAAGGYEISERFQLKKEMVTSDDYSYILTALQGLVSATKDQKAKRTLEKISYLSKQGDSGIILDFSVLQEGNPMTLQQLQTAIAKKHVVDFTYTNNNNETRVHSVEPIAVVYRWYAWYLLAYSKVKNDYRTYKLVRMSNLNVTNQPFEKEHRPADALLKEMDKTDSREYIDILIRCRETAKSRVIEYLKGTIIEEYSNGDALIKAVVVKNEQFWIGTLLSLGSRVEIMEPEDIRRRLFQSAKEIMLLYQEL